MNVSDYDISHDNKSYPIFRKNARKTLVKADKLVYFVYMLDYLQSIKIVENFLSNPFSFESTKIVSQPNIDRIWFPHREYKICLDKLYKTSQRNWVFQHSHHLFIPIRGNFKLEIGSKNKILVSLQLEIPSSIYQENPFVWWGLYPLQETCLSISVIGGYLESVGPHPPPISKGFLDTVSEQNLLDEFHESLYPSIESFQMKI